MVVMKASWLKIALIAVLAIVLVKVVVNLVPATRPLARFI